MKNFIDRTYASPDCETIFETITDAFYMGVEAGARLTEKRYRA